MKDIGIKILWVCMVVCIVGMIFVMVYSIFIEIPKTHKACRDIGYNKYTYREGMKMCIRFSESKQDLEYGMFPEAKE